MMGMFFFPRGGSAFAARELVARLPAAGWRVSFAAGSLGEPGTTTHAPTFYDRIDLVVHDYTPAYDEFLAGRDPMRAPVPMQPSYESRSGVADRDFAQVDPASVEQQIRAWERTLAGVRGVPDLVHLHHLTPLTAAALHRWRSVPMVVSLHGTELKWLLRHRDASEAPDRRPGAGEWDVYDTWAELMRRWAQAARYLTVTSEPDRALAVSLLDIDADRVVVIGSGVATDRFRVRALTDSDRLALWRRWLVESPRGWDESGRPGSVSYADPDLAEFVDPVSGVLKPVLLYVGRFTRVKRLSLLIEVYQRLRSRLGVATPPLVVWGGAPGEWEGVHPVTLVRQCAVRGVFFVGMREHDDLPLGLSCSDLLVVPSVNESFGQVYVEALAAGIPVIATRTGGPATFIATSGEGACGWLVAPDDPEDLLRTLMEAVANPTERRQRGHAGRLLVERSHGWERVVERLTDVYAACRPARPG
jgi:D-inositol-3-phosphate glycosyltransferase